MPLTTMLKRIGAGVLASAMLMLIPAANARQKKITYDREAKLFRLPEGKSFTVRYQHSRRGKGAVQIDLATRQVLTGEYIPVKNSDPRWGELFSEAAGSSSGRINFKGLQRGLISAEGSGLSIRCEYVSPSTFEQGFGFCKDSQDAAYRLMF